MRRLATLLVCSTLSSFVVVTPAFAQSKAELAAEDARIRQRLTTLEQRFLTGDPAAQQLMQRVDSLETTVRSLTGEVEQVRYERDTLRAEVKALADDLRAMQAIATEMQIHLDAVDIVADQRRVSMGTPPVATFTTPRPQDTVTLTPPPGMPPFGSVQPAPTQPAPAQHQFAELSALPDAGRTKLAEGNFAGAQSDFQQYLTLNPDASDAGEVQYWLGESLFVRGSYADAADAYIKSMRVDARGPKGAEAMVRLAAALRELGKVPQACQTLDSFDAQYPNASQAVRDKVALEKARTSC